MRIGTAFHDQTNPRWSWHRDVPDCVPVRQFVLRHAVDSRGELPADCDTQSRHEIRLEITNFNLKFRQNSS